MIKLDLKKAGPHNLALVLSPAETQILRELCTKYGVELDELRTRVKEIDLEEEYKNNIQVKVFLRMLISRIAKGADQRAAEGT